MPPQSIPRYCATQRAHFATPLLHHCYTTPLRYNPPSRRTPATQSRFVQNPRFLPILPTQVIVLASEIC
ncbi:hypothetical protein [Helicobacter macacae]|uniref:hypothetical protein n=1 Tax=Helicobacter macacae TaxID=398626 RepID=UPI0011DD1EF2|nr:hypothetical protein [Helicobacter macacae]